MNTCEVKEMNEGIAMRIKNRDIKRTKFRLGGDKWLRRPPPVACGCGESESRCLLPFFRIVWFFDLENGDDTRGHITLIVKSLSCYH